MKTFALATAAVLALLSIAGCGTYVGKGKAPPPVVNQGVTLYHETIYARIGNQHLCWIGCAGGRTQTAASPRREGFVLK
jgi:hypothetical protein